MTIIPNILTVARLLMVPLFIAIYVYAPGNHLYALIVYGVAMLTDVIDGRLARALKCESKFGTLVDPLADKLMTLAAVSCLTYSRVIPLAAMIIVLVRELTMISCATIAAKFGIVIKANAPGKISTMLFTVAIILTIPWHSVDVIYTIGSAFMWLAIGASLFAAIFYAFELMRRVSSIRVRQ